MSNLREAAQALLDHADWDLLGLNERESGLLADLERALAAPPEPGWGEGYRAGREDAAGWHDAAAEHWRNVSGGESTCAVLHAMSAKAIRALPVPSAPTQAAPETTSPTGAYVAAATGSPLATMTRDEARRLVSRMGSSRGDAYVAAREAIVEALTRAPAPEAKTAESDFSAEPTYWLVHRPNAAWRRDQPWHLFCDRPTAVGFALTQGPRFEAMRVRLTAAPVEPEDTHR